MEQGRGGSSGFSIRGVDRNRVAINVDGLPQLQSHTTNISLFYEPVGSGARNEVELENVSSVEIDKGSNSLQSGNGALGGSVNFRTKNVDDILSEGEKFALTSKTAYSSKNSQLMQSLGTAFNTGKLRGLFQYTHRDGKETKVHDNVMKKKYEITKLGAYVDKYNLNSKKPNTINQGGIFYKCEDCKEPFHGAKMTRFEDLQSAINHYKSSNGNRELTPEELAQLKQMVHPKEIVSAKDYTGPGREAPDPLKAKSDSYLTRLEYEITPSQLLGGIFEDTKQHYTTRDMTLRGYYPGPPAKPSVPDPRPKYPTLPNSDDFYEITCTKGNCTHNFKEDEYNKAFNDYKEKLKEFHTKKQEYDKSGIGSPEDKAWKDYDEQKREYEEAIKDYARSKPHPGSGGKYLDDILIGDYAPMAYTRARFSTETHHKKRQSLYYITEPKNKWADKIELNLDLQKIGIKSLYRELSCSKYPTVDKNCRASIDKPGSSETTDNVNYQEKHKHLGFKYDNSFSIDPITYRIKITGGIAHYNAIQNHYSYSMRFGGIPSAQRKDGSVYIPKGALGGVDERDIATASRCSNWLCDFKIKGKNRYVGLHNQISFSKWLDVGAGFRRDHDVIKGDKKYLVSRTYKNTTYQFNMILKPTDNITMGYNYSTGFRNPSYQEIFGSSHYKKEPTDHLKPETSSHHEVNLAFKGDWGYLEANKFISKYNGLISRATDRQTDIKQEQNFSNATIEGYGIQAWLDLHSIVKVIPLGFNINMTYEKAKPKKVSLVNERFILGYLYPFDAIQPPRFIVSLNYDSPSEIWGSSLIITHSKQKDIQELMTTRVHTKKYENHPLNKNKGKVTNLDSKPWTTLDLLGYYKIRKNIMLNVGIYNLLNKQYSTWESIRRSSSNSIHPDYSGNLARYSAPGRNYFVSVNMKF